EEGVLRPVVVAEVQDELVVAVRGEQVPDEERGVPPGAAAPPGGEARVDPDPHRRPAASYAATGPTAVRSPENSAARPRPPSPAARRRPGSAASASSASPRAVAQPGST